MNASPTRITHILRLAVLAGVALYVVGGLAGWFTDTIDLNHFRVHPHELVRGEWVWLLLLPPLLATIAPFTVRWVSFLWLAPMPALLLAAGFLAYQDLTLSFGYYFIEDGQRSWGLVLSVVGAALATVALVTALVVVIRNRDMAATLRLRERFAGMRPSRQRLTIGLMLLAVGGLGGLAIAVTYDPEANRIEKRLSDLVRSHLRENASGTNCERIRSGEWWCTYEVSDSSAGLITDGSTRDLRRTIGKFEGAITNE